MREALLIIDVQNDYFPGGANELVHPYEAEKEIQELDAYLKSLQIDTLIVCGMMTHMCVDTTVRAAMDYGYRVKLVADACATMDLELNGENIPADTVHKAFITALDGAFATIV